MSKRANGATKAPRTVSLCLRKIKRYITTTIHEKRERASWRFTKGALPASNHLLAMVRVWEAKPAIVYYKIDYGYKGGKKVRNDSYVKKYNIHTIYIKGLTFFPFLFPLAPLLEICLPFPFPPSLSIQAVVNL